MTLIWLSLAAASPPLNLDITNITSTSLTLEWEPPLTPNGLITSYRVKELLIEFVVVVVVVVVVVTCFCCLF